MKILNLYAGIGGNRKLWGSNHDITAVEYDKNIASIYKDFFPNDNVVIGDAHEYLLNHFKEFDFIWTSPPCPTHSQNGKLGMSIGQHKVKYPDMALYQEIILLQYFFTSNYCVENVTPYYEPMFSPQIRGRHCFWTNFYIHEFKKGTPKHHAPIEDQQKITGFDLSQYQNIDKRKILRNCVDSKLGLHIFNSAAKNVQEKLF